MLKSVTITIRLDRRTTQTPDISSIKRETMKPEEAKPTGHPLVTFLHITPGSSELMEQRYVEIAPTVLGKFISCVFALQGQERWCVGESNICCRVLLDVVRAKTHKVGYYLCKSRRVPEPRGKQPALHQAQSWTRVPHYKTTCMLKHGMLIFPSYQRGLQLTNNSITAQSAYIQFYLQKFSQEFVKKVKRCSISNKIKGQSRAVNVYFCNNGTFTLGLFA